ncbi:MAG: protein kinase [Myxococcota bacterium]
MSDLSAGARIGPYQVLEKVTQGGMATLYAVRRHGVDGFDQRFALKLIHPHLADDPVFVDMFQDEAAIAARVRHANVVQVFDKGEHENKPYLVMELLEGESLLAMLRGGETLELASAVYVLGEVAAGLAAAHDAKASDGTPLDIVHRDINPSNIHLGYDGSVRIIDFGVASAKQRRTKTRTGEVKGKLSYLAPEQIDGAAAVTPKLDLFSFGVTAWELLAGRRLFAADTDAKTLWNVLHRSVPWLADIRPEVPEAVASIVAKCLERDPAKRPMGAAEVEEALSSHAGHRRGLAAAMDVHFPVAARRKAVERLSDRPTADEDTKAAPLSTTAPTVSVAEPRRRGPAVGLALAVAALVASAAVVLSTDRVDTPSGPAATESAPESANETPPRPAVATAEQEANDVADVPSVPDDRSNADGAANDGATGPAETARANRNGMASRRGMRPRTQRSQQTRTAEPTMDGDTDVDMNASMDTDGPHIMDM